MPATVTTDPIAIRFDFPDGSSWTARFPDEPNPKLALDLLEGLATLTHPHGDLAKRRSAENYVRTIRQMLSTLAESGFTGSAGDLTKTVVLRWWLGQKARGETHSRRVLIGYDSIDGGLRSEVREQVAGRNIHVRQRSQPLQPYTESEWHRLTECCRSMIETNWSHHTKLCAEIRSDESPAGSINRRDIALLLARRGPMTHKEIVAHFGGRCTWQGGHGTHRRERAENESRNGRLASDVREALFPTLDIQLAYRLLFGIYTGIVPDGIDSIGVDGIDWAGDATVLLDYVKGRTGPEGLNLPPRAVRLLGQWLDHSAILREHAPPHLRDRLWIAAQVSSSVQAGWLITAPDVQPYSGRRFARRAGLTSDDGSPLQIDRRRIRTTYQSLLAQRGWTGRTTIDPNHTPAVEADHYLTATTPAQRHAVESIIENGQHDIVRKALPQHVLTEQQLADTVAGLPAALRQLPLTDEAIVELVGGERDVFVAACTDQLAGQWGPAGKPCPARPWVCLMCPLAVFMPRHVPNLLRLKAFFAEQFRQMPTDQFLQIFGPYADRLDTEILPRYDREISDHGTPADSGMAIALRPEERTA